MLHAGLERALSRTPMAMAALAAASGILFARLQPGVPVLAALLLLLALPWARRHRALGWLLLTVLAFAVLHRACTRPGERLPPILAQAGAESLPVEFTGAVQARLPGGGFRFRLDSLTRGTVTIRTGNTIHLQFATARIRAGDRLRGTGRLAALPPGRNPGERPLSRAVEPARIEVASAQQIEILGFSARYRAERFASTCREWISQAITRGIPAGSESADLIEAMVLGERDGTSPETEEAFRRSGAMHLFSVSGLHVAIFASLIWAMLRPFPVSRFQTVLLIAGASFFYAFITGLAPPAIRAAVMLSVVLFGFALRREARLLNSLGFSALLILGVDTRQLFDIGFQLSFTVMAAIALLCPAFERGFRGLASPDPFIPRSLISRERRRWEQMAQAGGSLVSVSLAAAIGSLPLTLWYFGLITPLSVLANCALVPASWLVMALATVSLGLNILHVPWLPIGVNQLNAACAGLLQALAGFFAHLPGAAVETTPLAQVFTAPPPAAPSLVVFDLQQSCGAQALVLPRIPGAPQPSIWLIDPGDFAGYARTVRPWLRSQRTRALEGLILTHGDSRHVDGAAACLKDFAVRRTVFSPVEGRSPVWRQLRGEAPVPGRIRLDLDAGSRMELAPGVGLRVLFPPAGHPDQGQADDECLVLLLEWQGWRILSLADSGFLTEQWLLEHEPNLRCDVLIRSSHREDVAGLADFLSRVRPRCVISTNTSFPASERLPDSLPGRLAAMGIRLFDQSLTGAVTVTPGPERLVVEPYWRGEPLVVSRADR